MQKAKEEYETTMAYVKLTFNEAHPNVTYAAATSVPKANAQTAYDACKVIYDAYSCNMV